jgi:uncharacterized protein YukE
LHQTAAFTDFLYGSQARALGASAARGVILRRRTLSALREMLMAKAHVDPAELRRFAQDLGRFNSELQGLMSGLNARMRGLENTWRDQEQRKFTEAFDQTMKVLAGFLEASQSHAGFLTRKATMIEEYLKQR